MWCAISSGTVAQDRMPDNIIITKWTSFTPSFIGSGVPSYTGRFIKRRVGDTLEIKAFFKSTQTGTSADDVTFVLPDSLTIDTSLIVVDLYNAANVGYGVWYNADSTLEAASLAPISSGLNPSYVKFVNLGPGAWSVLTWGSVDTNHTLSFHLNLPISQWT